MSRGWKVDMSAGSAITPTTISCVWEELGFLIQKESCSESTGAAVRGSTM